MQKERRIVNTKHCQQQNHHKITKISTTTTTTKQQRDELQAPT